MVRTEPQQVALKIAFKGEIHRLRVDINTFRLPELTALFQETFHLQEGSFVIQYYDPEGDCLNVTSEAEYTEACHLFLSGGDEVKAMRFVAVTRTQVVFQEHVADPILKAIEKLVETLNAAMEKVKQEQWAQRAQTGIDHTGEAIKSVAKDARESFSAARQSIQEIPFDQYMKDTTETIKSAAEGISEFAKEVVGEIKSYGVPPTPPPAAEAEAVVEAVEIVQPAPAAPTSSDSEWEEVAEQAEVAVPVAEEAPVMVAAEPEVVQVAAPVVSEAEQKWAAQLRMVNDIFPGVEASRVIERLEQSNGNVEVVVNALMEEM